MTQELDTPIESGSVFKWTNALETVRSDPYVRVLDVYVSEDFETQVRIEDGDEKRTVTVEDIKKRIFDGNLEKVE